MVLITRLLPDFLKLNEYLLGYEPFYRRVKLVHS